MKSSEKQQKIDAVSYIKISLADEQALQFAEEDNAKVLWDKIRATFIGQGENRKIDAGNELKNILMKNGETVGDYIARARGISFKCHSLGLDVSPRELVCHTVRGLDGKLPGLATDIFQQDNARPQVTRIIQRFFVNHLMELLPWPARSPDLSPIENMWSMVAQRLTQITSPAATPDQLWQRMEAAWSAVPQEHIKVFLNECRGVWQR
ncbi:transposable element Tcb1 transposase [Trichonephila clavipes]|nr:transposable element Tcb1 transposase [Trichonephila clavipes]